MRPLRLLAALLLAPLLGAAGCKVTPAGAAPPPFETNLAQAAQCATAHACFTLVWTKVAD